MTEPRYRVTIDKDACDGIFACLTRDSRFVEDEDGLATLESSDAYRPPSESDSRVNVEFEDGRIDDARAAAAACPPNAITVEKLDADAPTERSIDTECHR